MAPSQGGVPAMTGAWANGKGPSLPQLAREEKNTPGYFYYLEERGRREEKLAEKSTELATCFNNQIPVLLWVRLPPAVPFREIQARPGLGTGKPVPTHTTPAWRPRRGVHLPWFPAPLWPARWREHRLLPKP